MRQSVATVGLLEKFRQNEEERFDASFWTGSDILGFVLMEVRNMLRSEYDQKI